MRELRKLQNDAATAFRMRDEAMAAWAVSNTLSREDMAVATGLVVSRVNQIVRSTYVRETESKAAAMREQALRHLP